MTEEPEERERHGIPFRAMIPNAITLLALCFGLTGVSSFGGQTRNPYDVTRTPGGSSGGSGAAAAACLAAFTLGTDTSGSIRIPSSHNSLVGLRPSAGLSSRAGIIPFGHTQDTGGPMARTVEDIALVLDATVGYDPADPTTQASSGRIPRSYTTSLKEGALNQARIGVLTEFFGSAPEDQEVALVIRRAIDEMAAANRAIDRSVAAVIVAIGRAAGSAGGKGAEGERTDDAGADRSAAIARAGLGIRGGENGSADREGGKPDPQ